MTIDAHTEAFTWPAGVAGRLSFTSSAATSHTTLDRYTLAIIIYFQFFIDIISSLISGSFPSACNSLQAPVCPLILPHLSAGMPLFFRMAFPGIQDSTLCLSICGMRPVSLCTLTSPPADQLPSTGLATSEVSDKCYGIENNEGRLRNEHDVQKSKGSGTSGPR